MLYEGALRGIYKENEVIELNGVKGIYKQVAPRVVTLQVIDNPLGSTNELAVFIDNTVKNSNDYGIFIYDSKTKIKDDDTLIPLKDGSGYIMNNSFMPLTIFELGLNVNNFDIEDELLVKRINNRLKTYRKFSDIDVSKKRIVIKKESKNEYIAYFEDDESDLMSFQMNPIGDVGIFNISRAHYAAGVNRFFRGKGLAERIFKELAREVHVFASNPHSRSSSADMFWKRLEDDNEFEILRMDRYDFILWKKSPHYKIIKEYIAKNY